MSLLTEFRPSTLEEIVGNQDSIDSVRAEFEKPMDLRSHAYFLHGPRGCGKTTLSRIIASMCEVNFDIDFIEIDSGEQGGIDVARTVKASAYLTPMGGPSRVFLFDECHRLGTKTQEALLKIVEEPPKHSYFLFSTTDPHLMKPTLLDRCTQLQMKPLEREAGIKFLRVIARKVGGKVPVEIIEKIIEKSEGRPRTSLRLLNKVLSSSIENAESILEEENFVENQTIDLCRELMSRTANWQGVSKILFGLKEANPEDVRRSVLGYATSILMKGKRNDIAYLVAKSFQLPFYTNGKPDLVIASYNAMNDIEGNLTNLIVTP